MLSLVSYFSSQTNITFINNFWSIFKNLKCVCCSFYKHLQFSCSTQHAQLSPSQYSITRRIFPHNSYYRMSWKLINSERLKELFKIIFKISSGYHWQWTWYLYSGKQCKLTMFVIFFPLSGVFILLPTSEHFLMCLVSVQNVIS